MVSQYESGELDPDFLESRVGRLRLKIKPASGQYGAGNQVVDYLPRENVGAARTINRPVPASREKVLAGDLNDEIPF
jgi:hypothetical protein